LFVLDVWKALATAYLERKISEEYEEGELDEAEEPTDAPVPVPSSLALQPLTVLTIPRGAPLAAAASSDELRHLRVTEYDEITRLAATERARRPEYKPLPPDVIGLRNSDYDTQAKLAMRRNDGRSDSATERDRRRRRASYRKKTRNTPTKVCAAQAAFARYHFHAYGIPEEVTSMSPRAQTICKILLQLFSLVFFSTFCRNSPYFPSRLLDS
jgi:hypothetical protein